MRRILIALVAMVTLAASVPMVAPETNDVTASVTVESFCAVDVTPSTIDFGILTPTLTSSDQTITISQPETGNSPNINAKISGTIWTGLLANTMSVGQTGWALTDIAYGSMTSLSVTATPIGVIIGPSGSEIVHFKLQIPGQQSADSYTQTITVTACGESTTTTTTPI